MTVIISAILIGNMIRVKRDYPKQDVKRKTFRCPLCGSILFSGEKIRTEAFPGTRDGRIVHITGCEYCGNSAPSARKRSCPVCFKPVSTDKYLIGKMWNESGNIKVRIFGCSGCLKKSGYGVG
jgi:hypothetical protein